MTTEGAKGRGARKGSRMKSISVKTRDLKLKVRKKHDSTDEIGKQQAGKIGAKSSFALVLRPEWVRKILPYSACALPVATH
eukprot:1153245-Pelagomonas_calceolata.AAC.5